MSALFTPFTLKDVTLRNRIAIPPMCQYSAVDGFTNDWHWAHYAGMARGGAGLVIVEATGVSPEGRITPGCTGLWSDQHIEGMARVAASIKQAGAVPGIQIGHAGRKASANKPWEGDDHIAEGDPRGWDTLAPSAIAFGGGLPKVPQAMTRDDIARVTADFVSAARRARDAALNGWNCTSPTAIWRRVSSRRTAISAPMNMAAALKIVVAFCWKRWRPCAKSGHSICL